MGIVPEEIPAVLDKLAVMAVPFGTALMFSPINAQLGNQMESGGDRPQISQLWTKRVDMVGELIIKNLALTLNSSRFCPLAYLKPAPKRNHCHSL
jgi:hypothetical protein